MEKGCTIYIYTSHESSCNVFGNESEIANVCTTYKLRIVDYKTNESNITKFQWDSFIFTYYG